MCRRTSHPRVRMRVPMRVPTSRPPHRQRSQQPTSKTPPSPERRTKPAVSRTSGRPRRAAALPRHGRRASASPMSTLPGGTPRPLPPDCRGDASPVPQQACGHWPCGSSSPVRRQDDPSPWSSQPIVDAERSRQRFLPPPDVSEGAAEMSTTARQRGRRDRFARLSAGPHGVSQEGVRARGPPRGPPSRPGGQPVKSGSPGRRHRSRSPWPWEWTTWRACSRPPPAF